MNLNFSTRLKDEADDLKNLMKLSESQGIISFAGGFPAPELFPSELLRDITNKVLKSYPNIALQYGASEGYTKLRELIAKQRMTNVNINCSFENIIITNGSQQGLDFAGRLFINKGDKIIVEKPTYLGALTAFKAYEPEFLEVDLDKDGMNMDCLESLLLKNKDIKFIYTIPDFQNPSGITMSIEKRQTLCKLAKKYNVPVIEDNPYNELIFKGNPLPSIKSFDEDGYVIYLGTFSKTFCPGLRIGWMCAEEHIIDKLLICKQGADLQSSTFNQIIAYEFLSTYNLDDHIVNIRKVYSDRKNSMIKNIQNYFPNTIEYTDPLGGLFTFITLPKEITSNAFLNKSLQKGVAFVPGDSSFALGKDHNHIRLNYSYMTKEKSEEGIKILGSLLKTF